MCAKRAKRSSDRKRIAEASSARQTATLIILLAIVIYLVFPPLATLVFGALTDSPPGSRPDFTLATMVRAWTDPQIYPALVKSVLFAFCVATLVLISASLLAWVVERTNARVRSLANIIIAAPVIMPAVLLINGWIMLLSPRSGLVNLIARDWFGLRHAPFNVFSFSGMIWVAVLQELPLAFLWLWPSFRGMDPELEEAGLMCGGGFLKMLVRVTLPALRPALLGAWIIFFIYAFGALAVPLLIGQPAGIFLFSTEIYVAATQFPTDLNVASAYGLLYLAVSAIGIGAYRRFTREADRYATIRGRAFRPRRHELGAGRAIAEAAVGAVLLLVAVLPLFVLLWNAFMPFPQTPSLASLRLFTTQNFVSAWNYAPARRALANSLWLGAAAGAITTTLAFAIGWRSLRDRGRSRLPALLEQLAVAPVALPGLVVGTGLTWFYLELPIPVYGTPLILLLAYMLLHLPFAVRICAAGLSQLHRDLEESAAMAGAGAGAVLRRVVLPLVLPSAVASTLYVTLRSFREYAASVFLAGPGTEVVSVLVLDMSQSGNTNILAAYTVIISAVMLVAVIAFNRVEQRLSLR